jgi:hypothetical protein
MIRSLLPALLLVAACSAAELPAGLFVATAPADAVEVIAARAKPTPGAAITVRGVVGGRTKPIAEGHALFTIMDSSLMCATACGTGWSGCSSPPETLRGAVATVQVAGADGKPLAATLAGTSGLTGGATVVVRGTVAQGSGDKALIIAATAIHVVPATAAAPAAH